MAGLFGVFHFIAVAAFARVVDVLADDAGTMKTFRLASHSRNASKLQPCQQQAAPQTMVRVGADAGLEVQVAALRAEVAARVERLKKMEADNARMRKELHVSSDAIAQTPTNTPMGTNLAMATTEGMNATDSTTPQPTTSLWGGPIGPVPNFQEIPTLAPNSDLLPDPPGMTCSCTASSGEQTATTMAPTFAWSGYLDHGRAVQLGSDGKPQQVKDPELAQALEQALRASASAQHLKTHMEHSTAHQEGFKDTLKAYKSVAKKRSSSRKERNQAAVDLARAAMEKPNW